MNPAGAHQAHPAASRKAPSSHTYDNYAAKWDSFDVDAALNQVDNMESQGSASKAASKLPASRVAQSEPT